MKKIQATTDVGLTRYRVLYGDVDQMGVIYYGNYFRLFERGRAEFMRDRGLSYGEMEAEGLILPVTEAHCHYYQAAVYDELLLIRTWVSQLRRASLRFDYEIYRQGESDLLLIKGYTVHACVNSDRKIIRLPENLMGILSSPESN